MLQTLDTLWRDHLLNMEHLKEGIGLRGYGQENPLQAYQKEGYDMFEELIRRMEADVVEKMMSVQIQAQPPRASGRATAARPTRRGSERRCRPRSPTWSAASAQAPQHASACRTATRRQAAEGRDRAPRRRQGRAQRSVPVRQREEVQEVSRRAA